MPPSHWVIEASDSALLFNRSLTLVVDISKKEALMLAPSPASRSIRMARGAIPQFLETARKGRKFSHGVKCIVLQSYGPRGWDAGRMGEENQVCRSAFGEEELTIDGSEIWPTSLAIPLSFPNIECVLPAPATP